MIKFLIDYLGNNNGFTLDLKQTLEHAISSTVAFFSLFEKHLSVEELLQYLYVGDTKDYESMRRMSFGEVTHEINEYALEGGEDTKETMEAFEKLRHYLPVLRSIPGVRMIAVGNTHAFGVGGRGSDIDLFVVTKSGWIWMTRLLFVMVTQVLGIRRHGGKVAGRFCLSFFVTEDELSLSDIALEGGDPYLDFWIATLKPVWGEYIYDQFVIANDFALQHFPFWRKKMEERYLVKPHEMRIKRLLETLLSWRVLHGVVRWLQVYKMKHLPVKQNEYSSIVIRETMLKFHNNDRRSRYREAMRKQVISDTKE